MLKTPTRTTALALAVTMGIGTGAQMAAAPKADAVESVFLPAAHVTPKTAKTVSSVTTANLHLRTGAGTQYRSLGVTPDGEKVTVLQTSGDWAKITSSKGTGWSSTDYLTSVGSSQSSSGDVQYTTARLNLRTGAGTGYRSLGVLAHGAKVTVLKTSGNWAQVTSPKGTGWVSRTYISAGNSKPEASNPETSGTTAYATANVNIRVGAGTGYRSLGVLTNGSEVTVLSAASGWSKVKSSKGTGYVSSQYLSTKKGGSGSINSGAVKSDTQRVIQTLNQLFSGDYSTLHTLRAGSVGHSSGRAVDVMISNYKSASSIKKGDRIAQFLIDNRKQLGVSYLIWQDKIWLGPAKSTLR